ncbi:MAG: class I SAM-dependent methyltransferase [Gemmatimonadales bacterium]|nr:class I SAM-dependent methyltransferase [Gemmatimonadales bacterium]
MTSVETMPTDVEGFHLRREAPDAPWRLDPLPSDEQVRDFYEQRYYALVRAGERGPDVGRLAAGGPDAEAERGWLRQTLYADVTALLATQAPGRRVLEIGCGTGDLLAHLRDGGFAAEGVEIADAAVAIARGRGLPVHAGAFERHAAEWLATGQRWDALLFMNVLEQLRDPGAVLALAHRLLAPGGALVIRSGNDFNPLQLAAEEALGYHRWWVAVPDQVSYFSRESLSALCRTAGFEPVHAQGDFPMELFLLLGFDYLGDRALGGDLHRRRRAFELALPAEVRRAMYARLAEAGIGRCILLVARRDEAA